MSKRDKNYKPRRFRDEAEDKADVRTEKKLRGSRSAKNYMVDNSEEYASEPGRESEALPSAKIPSRVSISGNKPGTAENRAESASRTSDIIAELMAEQEAKAAETEPSEPAAASDAVTETETVPEVKAADEAPAAQKRDEAKSADPVNKADSEAQTRQAGEAADASGKDLENTDDSADKPSDVDSDYIITSTNHHKHGHRHHHHHHHHHSSLSVTPVVELDKKGEAIDESGYSEKDEVNPDQYIFESGKKKRKKMSKPKKVLITILCVILALVIGILGTFFTMREMGRRKMHNYSKIEITAPEKDESGNIIDTMDATGRIINYDGVSYEFNDNIMSITFIGVDAGSGADEGLSMGDVIYVLTVDAQTGKTKILGLSRDTMTDVDVYSNEGKFIDTEKLQLAYAHAYSAKGKTGGDNTLTTVSRP